MRLPFTKMQACGNDFVIVDHLGGVPSGFSFSAELAARIAHRQFGVGCDQILWLKPHSESASQQAREGRGAGVDAVLEILNNDGSRAEMCGNGVRAIGVYLRDFGPNPGRAHYSVGTASGPVDIDLSQEFPEVALGNPKVLSTDERITLKTGSVLSFSRVDMGNPHAVFFTGGKSVELEIIGPEIERHSLFPNRTNVEFVEVVSKTKLRVRVWERGAGPTLACGSGACAVVAAAESQGFVLEDTKIEVALPGGSVFVRLPLGWKTNGKSALLSGPTETVFQGVFRPRAITQ